MSHADDTRPSRIGESWETCRFDVAGQLIRPGERWLDILPSSDWTSDDEPDEDAPPVVDSRPVPIVLSFRWTCVSGCLQRGHRPNHAATARRYSSAIGQPCAAARAIIRSSIASG